MTLFVFEIDIELSRNTKDKFGEMLAEPDEPFAKAALLRRIYSDTGLNQSEIIEIVSVSKK